MAEPWLSFKDITASVGLSFSEAFSGTFQQNIGPSISHLGSGTSTNKLDTLQRAEATQTPVADTTTALAKAGDYGTAGATAKSGAGIPPWLPYAALGIAAIIAATLLIPSLKKLKKGK